MTIANCTRDFEEALAPNGLSVPDVGIRVEKVRENVKNIENPALNQVIAPTHRLVGMCHHLEAIRKGVRPPGFCSDFDSVWGICARLGKGSDPFSDSLLVSLGGFFGRVP
jgi:hypothetical protein